jgi:hypothetical protein
LSGSGEYGDNSRWHESVERPTIPSHLANEPARGGGVLRGCHQEGSFDLWREQPVCVRHAQLCFKVGARAETANDDGCPRFGSDTNGEI